jgi:hypothetical protein
LATNEERLNDVHAHAIKEFNAIQTALTEERKQCLQDRRFYSIAGAQWEDSLGDQFANLPRFEVNKIHLSVIRIINEYRNNRITVYFLPKDGSDDSLAENLNGLYRADEQDSCAQEAYDNSFEEKVGGGFGAWRLRAVYEDEYDEENEKQRIVFEPIFDADTTVFWNLDAKRQDKSDARRCWVLTSMSVDDYIEKFGDDPASWPKNINLSFFDWYKNSVVWVAEFYKIEDMPKKIFILRDLQDKEIKIDQEEYEERKEELDATGHQLLRTRTIKCPKVHKYIMSGNSILEDQGFIAGKHIPIVPNYGKRWFVDNIERCMGHVRLSKDAQRLKNMQLSRLGQIASLSPVEKPIFTPEQVAGHQETWADDNIENHPYMLINPITDANGQEMATGAIGYTKPPSIPQALATLLQITEQDMQDLLGNQQAGETLQNNQSGIATELVQNRLDMQTFIYMDNHAKAMKRCGEIWLSMAKEIYIEEGREMKTVSEHGDRSSITLMMPNISESGEQILENNLDDADCDVVVDVGPSFSSRKEKTVRALMNLLQAIMQSDPQTGSLIASTILMNIEGEGLADLKDYFRKKMVAMGVVKPTEEEQVEIDAAKQQPQQPDANTVYLESAAKNEQAKAIKAQADTQKTNAETAAIIKDMSDSDRKHTLDAIKTIAQITS